MDIDIDELLNLSVIDDGSLVILKSSSGNSSGTDSDPEKEDMNTDGSLPFPSHQTLKPTNDILEDLIDQDDVDLLFERELENLQLIQKTNEWMRSIITTSKEAIQKTSKVPQACSQVPLNDNNLCNGSQLSDEKQPSSSVVKPHQKMLQKISNSIRRRRSPTWKHLNRDKAYTDSIKMIQTFVQDYYQSLGRVSRYLIVTSILSFFSAFVLLSLYGAQTHSNDMDLFKLKEHQYTMSQEALEKYQLHHENFRESLIHQQYEEHRQCKTLLETCQSKRDALTEKLSRLGSDTGKSQGALEMKLESQQKVIDTLQKKLRELQQNNRELRQELGQSVMSSYRQILLSLWNIFTNRSLQIGGATFFIMCILINLILTLFPK